MSFICSYKSYRTSKSVVLLNISMAVLYQYNDISIIQLYRLEATSNHHRADIQCNSMINKN